MIKQKLAQKIDFDWIGKINGKTKEEILVLLNTVPEGSTFHLTGGYYQNHCHYVIFRDETDLEYRDRIEKERITMDRLELPNKANLKCHELRFNMLSPIF